MRDPDDEVPEDERHEAEGAMLYTMARQQPPANDDRECQHEFAGWREFEGGGEKFCQKCGLGAMAHTLRSAP